MLTRIALAKYPNLLIQLVRLHRTIPGQQNLDRVVDRAEYRVSLYFSGVREVLEDLECLPESPWHRMAPWKAAPAFCCVFIFGMKCKALTTDYTLIPPQVVYMEGEFLGYTGFQVNLCSGPVGSLCIHYSLVA